MDIIIGVTHFLCNEGLLFNNMKIFFREEKRKKELGSCINISHLFLIVEHFLYVLNWKHKWKVYVKCFKTESFYLSVLLSRDEPRR